MILNRDDRIVSADAAARRRLATLPEPRPVELPRLISPWTVQDHLKAIYEKAGVGSRGELVALVPGVSA